MTSGERWCSSFVIRHSSFVTRHSSLVNPLSWALIPLTEEQRAIQQAARDFARDELAPGVGERDRDGRFDDTLVPKLAALGFLGMLLPEEYEGLGLDTRTYLVALEEIAAVDA